MNRSFLTVSGFTLLSRITGFIRDILAASQLGAGIGMDIFLIAFKLPNFFRRLFAEGAFSVAFVPHYTAILSNKGSKEAFQFARTVGSALILFLVLFIFLMEVGMSSVIALTAPGLDPSHYPLTIKIARIVFPFIGWIALATFFAGILNAQEKFAASAAAGLFLNLLMISTLIIKQATVEEALFCLSWAVHVSGILQCIFLGFLCHKAGLSLTFKWPSFTPPLRQLIRKMGPAFLGGGVLQINAFIGLMIASLLPAGSISYLFYADRLVQLPLSIVGIALSTTLLPVLTKQLQSDQPAQAFKTQENVLKIGLILSLPAAVGLFFLASPIVAVLFGRGVFEHYAVLATGETLQLLSLGLPAYILVKIFSTVFFAHQDTRHPFHAGAFAVICDILLTLSFLNAFSYKGIALATSLSYWIQAGLLTYWLIKKRLLIFSQDFSRWLGKLFVVCSSVGILLYGIKGTVQSYFLDTLSPHLSFNFSLEMPRFIVLGGIVFAGAILFMIGFLLLKIVCYNDIVSALRTSYRKEK